MYASYFARCRMVAFGSDIPSYSNFQLARQDLRAISPDAILLFGAHDDSAYESFVETVQHSEPTFLSETILDPEIGEVGKLLWRVDGNH